MTETLTIRLPKALARELRAKASAARTNPSEVLRRAAREFVKSGPQPARNAMQHHIQARAGSWNGYCSGTELLRQTRP
jgi:predicted transcriptional regulator